MSYFPGGGSGDVIGPGTNTTDSIPQWNGANSKTLKDGLVVGTSANNLVQLNGSAELPAVSAANLTNIPASGANAALSNLNNIAINTALFPSGTSSMGLSSNPWESLFVSSNNSPSSNGQITYKSGATFEFYQGNTAYTIPAATGRVASFGPSAVASITVVDGLITAIS